MTPEAILDVLRETGALLEGHFQLSSGLHSERYFQCARVLQHPEHAQRLAQALVAKTGREFDLVVGPALGAAVWQFPVAEALGTRGIFTERVEGKMVLRRGFEVKPGERILLVEDVVTTGGSAREVKDLLESFGARVTAFGCIINRSGKNPYADDGLELHALAEVDVETFDPASCPKCAAGDVAIKPGSRPQSASRS